MALDRFVYFETELRPTAAQVERVIRNMLGGIGTMELDGGRWFVSLPGEPTAALAGIAERVPPSMHDERWIEVYLCLDSPDGPYLDVITRQTDDFTNAIAQRLAEVFAGYWSGRLET